MTNYEEKRIIEDLETRIKELGEKSSQTLLFLSFSLVVVATLKDKCGPSYQAALRCAMLWWSWALFPVVIGVLPVKEFYLLLPLNKRCWYCTVRWIKVGLLWLAVFAITVGAWKFIRAI